MRFIEIHRKAVSLMILAIVVASSEVTEAALVWNWALDSSSFRVAENDAIPLRGTLENLSESTITLENLESPLVLSFAVLESEGLPYEIDDGAVGPATFWSQFSGLLLAPGEEIQFDLLSFLPPNGGVPRGDYNTSVLLVFLGTDTAAISSGAINISVVPIPAPWLLILLPTAILTMRSTPTLDRFLPSLPLRSSPSSAG